MRNITSAADILNIVITLDTDDLFTSTTEIDLAEDDLTLGDQIVVDIDSVGSSTKFMSMIVEIEKVP